MSWSSLLMALQTAGEEAAAQVPPGMSAGAWIMLVVGCVILYGGLLVCLFIAVGAKKYDDEEGEEAGE